MSIILLVRSEAEESIEEGTPQASRAELSRDARVVFGTGGAKEGRHGQEGLCAETKNSGSSYC